MRDNVLDRRETETIPGVCVKISVSYIVYFAVCLAGFGILYFFGGHLVLMDVKDLWMPEASVWEAASKVWWLFIWGAVATLAVPLITGHREVILVNRGTLLGFGSWVSLNAGFFEELIFRWLAFFSAMILLPLFNFITFGFVGWLYREALIPLANFATFGALEPQLHNPVSWVFGAAIVMAAGKFRNAHEHLGFLGYVNSWFGGMILFWVMFHYGLFAAMVVHFLYDAVVYTCAAFAAETRR